VIHTRTEMKAPTGEILAGISAMTQTSSERGQQAGAPSAVRPMGSSGEEANIRYAVQVGASNIAENSKALTNLLKSRKYEPWVKPNPIAGEASNYVLVGKFATKAAADQFGKLMQEELPWVDDYAVKQTVLDLDSVLRETRTGE
ncbi:SPOR domain-containing protein, partial [Candidatus Poribacteria bacterium]